MTVSQWLKKWRKEQGLSQGDVGKMLKCTPNYLANIETGSHTAPVTFVSRLMPFLGRKQRVELESALEEALLSRKMGSVKKQVKSGAVRR